MKQARKRNSDKIRVYSKDDITDLIISKDAPIYETVSGYNDDIHRLRKSEWQRWAPGIGVYRLIKDHIVDSGKDGNLLCTLHSKTYETANSIYNIVQGFAIAGAGIYALNNLIDMF